MKNIGFLFLILLLCPASLMAIDFAPQVMAFSGTQPTIEYEFDGSSVDIPFTLNGTHAAIWFVVNTKDEGENIGNVRNGYLGWHYVNKIDTTIYISSQFERDPGSTQYTWDGKDGSGSTVPAGTYSYYLWGYDNKTNRQLVSDYVPIGFDWESKFTHIYTLDTNGAPLAKPLIMGSRPWWHSLDHPDSAGYLAHGNVFKWTIGNDPNDVSLIQTTWCDIYLKSGTYNALYNSPFSYGGPVFNPNDYNTFYQCVVNVPGKINTMMKWEFVPSGNAVRDEEWLGWDNLTWEDNGEQIAMWSQKPSCFTDGNYIYVNSPGLHQKTTQWDKLRCVSFDGTVIFDKMMNEWYMPNDPNPHGYVNSAFHHLDHSSIVPNNWLIATHTSCLHEMIDTTRLLEDADDETDMIVWQNSNGDYFMDSAYAQGIEPAWYCLADSKETSMRRDSVAIDHMGFNVIGVSYLGLMSFGVSTQDGTGIGYMQFADDTVADDANVKLGGQVVDYGSAYDGLYWAGNITPTTVPQGGNGAPEQRNVNFIAFDTTGGVITDQVVAVEEETPVAFSVAQNSPNPFNPTTTINFMIPKADRVTVEVFNIAGQKVSTLVNGTLSAGNHSIVWNAAGNSAGVYFYTVKAGSFSKTMKMTLLK